MVPENTAAIQDPVSGPWALHHPGLKKVGLLRTGPSAESECSAVDGSSTPDSHHDSLRELHRREGRKNVRRGGEP